jgi:hypothetical protein
MGVQAFYDQGPHPLLWARSRAARGKITISGTPNRLNYCVIFMVYAQFTNLDAGRITEPGGPRIGNQCFKV